MPFVHTSLHANIAVLTIHNPPVNALSPGVPEAIAEAVEAAGRSSEVAAIIVIGAGHTFIAGADIREFGKIVSGQRPPLNLLPLLQVIEDSPKPVVIAIHGAALGGGLETALCGHYRVIAAAAQVGQPEVKLGLIPGAGGTQRLPRVAGIAKALEMCAWGEPVPARDAVQCGIADRLVEGDLLAGAIEFAREIAYQPFRKTRERNDKLHAASAVPTAETEPRGGHVASETSSDIFAAARSEAAKRARGQQAPLAAIEAVEAATRLPFAGGCAREAELFRDCLYSTQSKALIHAFFAERAAAKIPGISKAVKPLDIQRAAVVGAGTMGAAIAMTYANAGILVLLKDSDAAALERGMDRIRDNYAKTVAKGRLSAQAAADRIARITPQLDYNGFEHADVITEAVFESTEAKKQVWRELDRVAKPDCLLATNTSSLDIDELASATSRPHLFIGNHFFSPAHVMRLLEVVRGRATSDEAIVTSMALARKLGKVAVLARNSRGFIGNRMVGPYLREAQFLLEEGASVEQVNDALYTFGMAMGPLAVDDLSGLDISHAIRKEFAHLEKPGVRKPLVAGLLCEQKRFGQKSGRGWSQYDAGRRPSPDPDTAALIEQTAQAAGINRRRIANEEIVDRCIYALVNEGARLLEEGVAMRASDIDVTYLYGYGFPAWRGGPMFYADTVGLPNVLARIRKFEQQHGSDLWSPAPLLLELAAKDTTFSALDAQP